MLNSVAKGALPHFDPQAAELILLDSDLTFID
jgi:hypothetical protein